VVEGVGRAIEAGAKAYWVCPLVEESETLDVSAATDRHAALAERFGRDRVALVHGRMKGPEKDAAMTAFSEGEASVLVATDRHDVNIYKSGRNIPGVTVSPVDQLNALAVLAPRRVLTTPAALDAVRSRASERVGETIS